MDTTYNLNGAFKPATKRVADLDGADFYPTPAWATQALIANEKFEGVANSWLKIYSNLSSNQNGRFLELYIG
jgi:hypothetical protein